MMTVQKSPLASDVQQGITQATTTRQENNYAMMLGNKVYVKKAGRSLILNMAGQQMGGVAYAEPTYMLRSEQDPQQMWEQFLALPASLQEKVLEQKPWLLEAVNLPKNTAWVRFTVIFGNGSRWSFDATAHPSNVKSGQQPNDMATARAFGRLVGFFLADGLIKPEQMAGYRLEDDDEMASIMGDDDEEHGFARDRLHPGGAGGDGTVLCSSEDDEDPLEGTQGGPEVHPTGVRGRSELLCQSATGTSEAVAQVLALAADRGVDAEALAQQDFGRPLAELTTTALRDLYRRMRSM